MSAVARIGMIPAVWLVLVSVLAGTLHAAPLTFSVQMSEVVDVFDFS